MLFIGFFLIAAGYLILFAVSENSPEKMMIQAVSGLGLSIAGAVVIMLWIFKRGKS